MHKANSIEEIYHSTLIKFFPGNPLICKKKIFGNPSIIVLNKLLLEKIAL